MYLVSFRLLHFILTNFVQDSAEQNSRNLIFNERKKRQVFLGILPLEQSNIFRSNRGRQECHYTSTTYTLIHIPLQVIIGIKSSRVRLQLGIYNTNHPNLSFQTPLGSFYAGTKASTITIHALYKLYPQKTLLPTTLESMTVQQFYQNKSSVYISWQ